MRNLLIVAGLDPTAGAGLLADARVACDHGLRAVGVVTALTEQDTRGMRAANPVSAEVVGDQLRALLADVEVVAVKIGALGTEAIARAVGDALAATAAPVVWDPVLAPSVGSARLYDDAPESALIALASHVTVVTPNLAEASAMIGREVETVAHMRSAAVELAGRVDAALVTGGHLQGDAIDVLATGDQVIELAAPRVGGSALVHGTGCALSTAIACALALGASVEDAVRTAKQFVTERLRAPLRPGRGAATLV